jgi:hypothetical protein
MAVPLCKEIESRFKGILDAAKRALEWQPCNLHKFLKIRYQLRELAVSGCSPTQDTRQEQFTRAGGKRGALLGISYAVRFSPRSESQSDCGILPRT